MQNNFGPTGDVSLLAPFSSILVSYTKDVLKEEKGKIISFSQYGEDVLVYVMQTLKKSMSRIYYTGRTKKINY